MIINSQGIEGKMNLSVDIRLRNISWEIVEDL